MSWAAFWAGYLIFFGTTFAFGFADMVPNREPYHVMNAVALIFILALDFLLRIPFQKTPTQEVKPYLLLPVKRNRIIDFLLIRSGLSLFNLFWLFMFVPFSFITITKYFGISGVITYLIGIWLLIVANNYWYLLMPHTNQRTYLVDVYYPSLSTVDWAALPLFPKIVPSSTSSWTWATDIYNGNILCFLGTILVIAILWLINRKIMSGLIYAELAKVDDTRIKHVSEYKFFERYGEVGEYMRLELKMLLRNRRCKGALRNVLHCSRRLLRALLSFSSLYDTSTMTTFICVYNFAVFGMIILSQTHVLRRQLHRWTDVPQRIHHESAESKILYHTVSARSSHLS